MRSIVERFALEAAQKAFEFRRSADRQIEDRGNRDLVTAADRAIEKLLADKLAAAFPGDGIYGEEGTRIESDTGLVWIIDPIDGTQNFYVGDPNWAIAIGLLKDRVAVFGVIYAPDHGWMFSGGADYEPQLNGKPLPPTMPLELSKGSAGVELHPSFTPQERLKALALFTDNVPLALRCTGSASISLLKLAQGHTVGYFALGDALWDVVAGLAILNRLGLLHTLNWERAGEGKKFRVVCGTTEYLRQVSPLLTATGTVSTEMAI